MNHSLTNRFNLGVLALAVAIAAVAVLSGVMAARAYDDDGRINLVNHLGGDAVFCVGADMTANDSYANGGIRLLSQSGQERFFVPAATINAVPELPLVDTRIAQGWGTHGVVELWRLTNGDFSLVGQDEHGKHYIFTWTGCTQIGPDPEPRDASHAAVDEPECEEPVGGNGNDPVPVTQEPGCEEPQYEN